MQWPLLMVVLSFALCLLALARLLLNLLLDLRARTLLPVGVPPLLFRCLWWPLIALAQLLAPHLRAPWRVRLMQRLYRADLESALEPGVWAALQWLLAGSALVLAACRAAPLIALAPVLALLPELWLALRIRARRRQVLQGWHDSLGLLALALETGCGFRRALALVVAHTAPGPLRLNWQRVLHDLRGGRSRQEALLRMERRMGQTAISSVIAAMNQAESGGLTLATVLRAQLGGFERQHRAVSPAQPSSLRLLRPLALCTAPCLCLMAVLPFLH